MRTNILAGILCLSSHVFAQQSFTIGIGGQMTNHFRRTDPNFETSGGYYWERDNSIMAFEKSGFTTSIQGVYTNGRLFVPLTIGLQLSQERIEGDETWTITSYSQGNSTTDRRHYYIDYQSFSTYLSTSTGVGYNFLKINREKGVIGAVARINPTFEFSRRIQSNLVHLDSSYYNSVSDTTTYGWRNYDGANTFIVYASDSQVQNLMQQFRPSLGILVSAQIGDRIGLSGEFDYLFTPATLVSFGNINLQYRVNFMLHLTYSILNKN